ncbi:hypothetical protein [Nocardia flavorosea]|uniref:Uncharacterized protein n=1 Tax=Nocardia flavorosea TaxID=53429 RepID=A0A846YEW6_9NOCA|nr:hypothetical protein [Nocardia flavorosea]NKY56270.1 hypothetical protein [Nocardia flavorosea]
MSIENRLAVLEAQVVQIINERDREPESVRGLRARIDSNHNAVVGELGSLHADVQDLRTGQARLEAGQTKLRADVQDLRAGQARLEAGQARLDTGQAELRADVATLQQGQQAVMDKLAEILSKLQ